MQRRLLVFFQAVRTRSVQIEWTFALRTVDNLHWPETMIVNKGLPQTWILFIEADASFQFTTKLCNGCFSAHRVIRPRKAAFHFIRESEILVADVLAEFSQRAPGLQ
jgi:hypothetical protein